MIDAVVTGRSLPALQTALDLAEVGLKVALLAGSERVSIAPAYERDFEGALAEFIRRIAQPIEREALQTAARPEDHASAVVAIVPQSPLLLQDGKWLAQSAVETLGIPAVPLASENIALLGMRGALRAFLDRVTPLLTVGKTRLLGELVQKRMGARVRDRLVDPQVFARYGARATEVDAAIAAPGLNEALSRVGALSSAVLAYSDRNVARETAIAPAQGGKAFLSSILHRLELYEVQLLPTELSRASKTSEGWALELADGSALNSRSFIADFDGHPEPEPALAQLVGPVAPTEARIHAVSDIDMPEWLPAGATAIAIVDDWAVSIGGDVAEQDVAPPSHQAARSNCEMRLSSRVGSVEELAASVKAGELESLPISTVKLNIPAAQQSPVHSYGIAAAPYRSAETRSLASEKLVKFERENPTLLPVGRAIHGDDQGAALAAAHSSAVHLRRRLLGLEEVAD